MKSALSHVAHCTYARVVPTLQSQCPNTFKYSEHRYVLEYHLHGLLSLLSGWGEKGVSLKLHLPASDVVFCTFMECAKCTSVPAGSPPAERPLLE